MNLSAVGLPKEAVSTDATDAGLLTRVPDRAPLRSQG
jgi:hypothetical protein